MAQDRRAAAALAVVVERAQGRAWSVTDVHVLDLAIVVLRGRAGELASDMLADCVVLAARGAAERYERAHKNMPRLLAGALNLAAVACRSAVDEAAVTRSIETVEQGNDEGPNEAVVGSMLAMEPAMLLACRKAIEAQV